MFGQGSRISIPNFVAVLIENRWRSSFAVDNRKTIGYGVLFSSILDGGLALNMSPISIQPAPIPLQFSTAQARDGRASSVSGDRRAVQTTVADPAQTEQVKKVVDALKQTDRAVRAHEQAHLAAAGGLALGGPSFTFQYGPDGRAYAVAGEVPIDTSPGRTPEESIRKAQQIRAAALAPSDPSSQDRAVAAKATQLEIQAQQELAQKTRTERADAGSATTDDSAENSAAQGPQERRAIDSYNATAATVELGALINLSA